jgi:hypothetical protein
VTPDADVFVICAMCIAIAWGVVASGIVSYYIWKKVRDGRSD